MKAVAYFEMRLLAECPHCHDTTDLLDQDHDNDMATALTTNAWNKLKDYDVLCPTCEREFVISGVEY